METKMRLVMAWKLPRTSLNDEMKVFAYIPENHQARSWTCHRLIAS